MGTRGHSDRDEFGILDDLVPQKFASIRIDERKSFAVAASWLFLSAWGIRKSRPALVVRQKLGYPPPNGPINTRSLFIIIHGCGRAELLLLGSRREFRGLIKSPPASLIMITLPPFQFPCRMEFLFLSIFNHNSAPTDSERWDGLGPGRVVEWVHSAPAHVNPRRVI